MNICKECGAQNETEFKYCKNCGALISSETEKSNTQPQTNYYSEPQYSQPVNHYAPPQTPLYTDMPIDNIDGVSTEELSLFVGKKADTIVNKFIGLEKRNSKVSWCWPVAILSYILGPFGASFWFFYRKMYKPAFLLSLIGFFTYFTTAVLNFGSGEYLNEFLSLNEFLRKYFSEFFSGNFQSAINLYESIDMAQYLKFMFLSFFNSAVSILIVVFCGMFSMNIYKNHAVKKIKGFKSLQTDSTYYKLGINALGGVSGGMVTLGIALFLVTRLISNLVIEVLALL